MSVHTTPTVVGLNYYPIKSCGAVKASEATLTEFGIAHDRKWMLVGSNGQFLSQRILPELARVQTSIEDNHLIAEAPNMGRLAISLDHDPDAQEVGVTLWKKSGTGTVESAGANKYFSEYLGRKVQLLRIAQPRPVKPECRVDGASARTGFADGFPILLASTDSLAELNTHLDKPVPVDRFRANVIIEGAPAYDEDYWREIRIGGLRAFVVRACARCPMPNIDQQAGVLLRQRPVSDALSATRQGIDPVGGERGKFFGQNVVHVFEPGVTVKVGDPVTIETRSAERNWQALPQ